MSFNFGQHLEELGSGDHNVRSNAYNVQQKFLATHMADYLYGMVLEIANESNTKEKRHLAAILIKNAVTGTSEEFKQKHEVAWMSIPREKRHELKTRLLAGLGIQDNAVRGGCAQAVAAIGIVELQIGNEWNDLIQILLQNAKSNNVILQEGTLTTLGLLCEEIRPSVLESQSSTILDAIVSGANLQLPAEVRRASIKALLASLGFVKNNFEVPEQRNYIMQVIFSATKSEDNEVRYFAVQCLVRVAENYYQHLKPYMDAAWEVTLAIFNSGHSASSLQAIEFWHTVAEIERDFLDDELDFDANECKDFSKHIAPQLLPLLCRGLAQQSEDLYEDDWNIAKASASCITMFASTVKDDVAGIVMPFVKEYIRHADWHYREASIMAFGSILSGPEESDLESSVKDSLPILIHYIENDPVDVVKETSAWAVSRAADYFSDVFIDSIVVPVLAGLSKGTTNEETPIAARCCQAIYSVLGTFRTGEDTSALTQCIQPLFRALLAAADREDAYEDQLGFQAYEAINTLIKCAPEDCTQFVCELVTPFIQKLTNTFATNTNEDASLQSYISSVLLTICDRLQEKIAPLAPVMINALIEVFKHRKAIVDDTMMALSAVINQCPQLPNEIFVNVAGFVLEALQKFDESSVIIAGLNCLGCICDVKKQTLFTDDQGQLTNRIVTILLQDLQQPELSLQVKPMIIIAFSELALALGPYFENYLQVAMKVLYFASGYQLPQDPTDDQVDYLIALREAILETYAQIIQNLGAQQIQQLSSENVEHLLKFLVFLFHDAEYRTLNILNSMLGIIGDLAAQIGPNFVKYMQEYNVREIVDYGYKRGGENNRQTKELAAWASQKMSEISSR